MEKENILKIGDKVKGFEYKGKYGATIYEPSIMNAYVEKVGTVKRFSDFNSDIVEIDFGDDSFWYPKDEALAHKVGNSIDYGGRVYTKATPLLKEIWRLYSGRKDGFADSLTTFFDNCYAIHETGGFYASQADKELYEDEVRPYEYLTEEEFIRFMEFDQDLISRAESNVPVEEVMEDVIKTEDVVNSPKHYTDGKIEVIDFIEDKKLGFHLGNSVKYISRAGKKDPNKTKEDLNKAIWYIKRYIDIYLTDDEETTDNL